MKCWMNDDDASTSGKLAMQRTRNAAGDKMCDDLRGEKFVGIEERDENIVTTLARTQDDERAR